MDAGTGVNGPAAAAFRAACAAELDALKPGNVHRHADGHGMTVAQFEASAEAAAPEIARSGAPVGARVLAAVEATWAAVGCNTNLGIVLLCAPLARAAEAAGPGRDAVALAEATRAELDALTVDDAELAYRAIVRANPGGLGRADRADVHAPPGITLRAAMMLAADHDRIAFQYAHAYADVFEHALPALRRELMQGAAPESATTAVYLDLLARQPDSHVLRKFGDNVAHSVTTAAQTLQTRHAGRYAGAAAQAALIDWDTQLKSQGINPGTTADLTVATWFAYLLAHG